MSSLRRGFLYLARLDERRPVLVVSPDFRNERASDVIVVPSTTRLRVGPTCVRLKRREGGVSSPSTLKCEQITTLHRDDIDPAPLGSALSARRLAEVERAILRALGIPVGY